MFGQLGHRVIGALIAAASILEESSLQLHDGVFIRSDGLGLQSKHVLPVQTSR